MVRYVPERALPPYAYAPGEHPHPTRDPRGHSHGQPPEPLDVAFAWGVDLYNHGYFWEAHEAWEPLWRSAASGSAEASFFAGLIQTAAACLKARGGATDAAHRIGERALDHLRRANAADVASRGLDVERFAERLAAWLQAGPVSAEHRPGVALSGGESV